jgi:FRG domain
MDVAGIVVESWRDFNEFVLQQESGWWIYRGQKSDWPLKTTLERAIAHWAINFSNAPGIETHTIRDFKRKYRGPMRDLVESDTFYCLALMQHHGAPTRLLDCTYSPFVAARAAPEVGGDQPVVWCIRAKWCESQAEAIVGFDVIAQRGRDASRNDLTFRPLYIDGARKPFVLGETPFPMNERVVLQQGIFLCPGDITRSIEDNVTSMNGWDLPENIIKIVVKMTIREKVRLADNLRLMNVNSDVLFPGLDGFARSFGERLYYFERLAKRGIG